MKSLCTPSTLNHIYIYIYRHINIYIYSHSLQTPSEQVVRTILLQVWLVEGSQVACSLGARACLRCRF